MSAAKSAKGTRPEDRTVDRVQCKRLKFREEGFVLTLKLRGCSTWGMALRLSDGSITGIPPEPLQLGEVTVHHPEIWERERFDEELATKH